MIKLGNKVKDIVSGFKGITISRIEYLNGCIQYGVRPISKNGEKREGCEYIDEEQLEIIGKGINIISKKNGGVMSEAPK